MPFQFVTENQRRLIERLAEALETKQYASTFSAGCEAESGWLVTLHGSSAGDDATFGVEEHDLLDLQEQGYLRLIQKKGYVSASLKPKALREYREYKGGEELGLNEKDQKEKKVFVVHGRDQRLRVSLFQFLRAIGLHPIEWSEAVALTGKATPYIGDVLDCAFRAAQAIVVLLTGDDEARLREQFVRESDETYEKNLAAQARPNVLFEAGLACGRCPDRTILVEVGSLRPFSDIAGRHVVRLTDSTKKRQELANRLQTAGCVVNLSGTDWHDTGDFSPERDTQVNSNDIKRSRKQRSVATGQASEQHGQAAASESLHFVAEDSELSSIEALDYIGRVVDRGSSYSTLGWTILLRNRGDKPEKCSVRFRYRDRTPVGVKEEIFRSPLIPPDSTREFSGIHTIKNTVADQIVEVLFTLE